jgi:cytochrome c oxidase subunit 2
MWMCALAAGLGERLGVSRPAWWMPRDGALDGGVLDHLMELNLIALTVLLVAAHLLLAYFVLRRKQLRRVPRLWAVEGVPLALLCALYVWMAVTGERLWAAHRFLGAQPGAMQVEVTGVQFQWYFRYPGRDAVFGRTRPTLASAATGNPLGLDASDARSGDDVVASELVLPAGREVDLRITAQDVMHGFFVPGMRVKQNAVPGMVVHVHFTPRDVGVYPVLCTQVCGMGHGHMQARLRVMSESEFDAWLGAREQRRLAQP